MFFSINLDTSSGNIKLIHTGYMKIEKEKKHRDLKNKIVFASKLHISAHFIKVNRIES